MQNVCQKNWSQVVFLQRDSQEVEALVEGYLTDEQLVVTSITDVDGNDLRVTDEERTAARECLYDSIVNYTGPG